MSHTTIAATRDYLPGHDKGDLINPAQSASFTVDPLLTPIKTSQLPKPILPDPTPSENPELFDQSTRHPNTHYHPEAKLSKKKRAKKLGTGYVAKPHPGGVHAGGRTFSEHEKEAHERAERRDEALGHLEEDEEWVTDDEGEAQQEEQSHAQHHENRITGSEEGNTQQPKSKRNDNKSEGDEDEDKEGQEGRDDKEKDSNNTDNPSLMQRATNVLSSAQQRASDVASSVTSTAMSTAQSVPVLGTLLSKVGLGAAKTDKSSDKGGDKADEGSDDQLGGEGDEGQTQKSGGGGGGEPNKKVGGQKAKDVEAVTKGAGAQATTETATKGGNEVYGKEGARQDNNEGALDKSRSQAGQKHVDNMKAA